MYEIILDKKKITIGAAAVLMAGILSCMNPLQVHAAEGLDMSTDYPGISVKAGETVNFDLDFTADAACDASLSIDSIPDGWTGYFRGSESQVSKVHINPDEESTSLATFSLTLPDEVSEATYKIRLKANAGNDGSDILELEVTVSEEEVGQSNFSAEYPEQQGSTGTSFSFDATIVNSRGIEQSYSLSAEAPTGWQVSFTPSGESSQVASLNVDAGSNAGLTVDVVPTETVEEGEYTIPCTAVSANDTLSMELKIIIIGTYDVELTTPTGNLSLDAYANSEKSVTLTVKNNGNVELKNLELTSFAPSSWEVRFEESTIESLAAGESKDMTAYIKPDSDAMTGDYVTSFSVTNDETTGKAEFRASVKTRTTWGIAAIAIIAVLLLGLGHIFKKYGRR